MNYLTNFDLKKTRFFVIPIPKSPRLKKNPNPGDFAFQNLRKKPDITEKNHHRYDFHRDYWDWDQKFWSKTPLRTKLSKLRFENFIKFSILRCSSYAFFRKMKLVLKILRLMTKNWFFSLYQFISFQTSKL